MRELDRLRFEGEAKEDLDRLQENIQQVVNPLVARVADNEGNQSAITALQSAIAALQAAAEPPGIIKPYGGSTAPTGALLCDGASYLRVDQQDLFDVIGTAYGAADGTHFNVPDFEGRFLRGHDNGAGRDPDAAGRTAMATGGATGDNIGSIQGHQLDFHGHSQAGGIKGSGAGGGGITGFELRGDTSGATQTAFDTFSNGNAGGNETRPINAYVNFIITT